MRDVERKPKLSTDQMARTMRPLVTIGSGSGGGATDHGDLDGLSDDDHPQYVHITAGRTIQAQHHFAPSTPGAPFTLSANAQSQTIAGLRADQLNKTITAGDGLTGGGLLITDQAIDLLPPGDLSATSTQDASGNHTHQIITSASPGQTQKILATDTSGHLQLFRLALGVGAPLATRPLHIQHGAAWQARLGYDDSNYADLGVGSGGTLTIAPTGDLELGPAGNDILPSTSYAKNLGAINRKYLTLHAGELWVENLVAQDTIATVGGRILVGPTTTLIADLADDATTIDVKHNQMSPGDRVYMEAGGKVEFMSVTSGPFDIDEGYRYGVARNLDGTGANEWYAGDAIFNTGAAGDGWIDLYSLQGVLGNGAGPTIVGNYRYGGAYSAWRPAWAVGNLNGLYGYGIDTYGVGLGHHGAGNTVTIDAPNGIRFFNSGGANIAQFSGTDLRIGQSAGRHVTIDAAGVYIHNGATRRLAFTSNLYLIGTNVENPATTAIAIFGAAQTYNDEAVGQYDILIGDNTAGKSNLFWDRSTGRLHFRGGTTSQAYIDTDGTLTAGGGTVTINANGMRIASRTTETFNEAYAYRLGTAALPNLGRIWHFYDSSINQSTLKIQAQRPNGTNATALDLIARNGQPATIRMTSDSANLLVELAGSPSHSNLLDLQNADIRIHGNIIKRDDFFSNHTGYIFVPATAPYESTAWDGDAKNQTAGTTIDLSSAFGLPAAIKAVAVKLTVKDNGNGVNAAIGPVGGSGAVQCITVANQFVSSSGIVPCNGTGDIVFFNSAQVDEVYVQIYGYFI